VSGRVPLHQPTLSVIIPCWNDVSALRQILQVIRGLEGISETIVADASEANACRAVAEQAGVQVAACARPNRGAQMNTGAALARSAVLLFQHADTNLTQAHLDALLAAMGNPSAAGGAFHRKFDGRHPWSRTFEPLARILAERGGTLYGDQSIFVRREVFEQLGGFAAIPLMEDVEFSRRLRRAGKVVVLDPPISTSPRHHERRGAIRTSIRNGLMIALYRLGISPQRLHAWYYRGFAAD
jgi:rSAM/selenodomain-associated transferase 2